MRINRVIRLLEKVDPDNGVFRRFKIDIHSIPGNTYPAHRLGGAARGYQLEVDVRETAGEHTPETQHRRVVLDDVSSNAGNKAHP